MIPSTPGLYRVRRSAEEALDYIGQTGLSLRRRLAMLAGVYKAEMPYRDPHTGGPTLSALRHPLGGTFEVSVLPVPVDVLTERGWKPSHSRAIVRTAGALPLSTSAEYCGWRPRSCGKSNGAFFRFGEVHDQPAALAGGHGGTRHGPGYQGRRASAGA